MMVRFASTLTLRSCARQVDGARRMWTLAGSATSLTSRGASPPPTGHWTPVGCVPISAGSSPGAEHRLGRNTLHEAAERLVDQGHLGREGSATRVIDPLLREWLRRR